MRAASQAKIGAGIPDSDLLAARPSGQFVLRFVLAPTITRTFVAPVLLSPPTPERLRGQRRPGPGTDRATGEGEALSAGRCYFFFACLDWLFPFCSFLRRLGNLVAGFLDIRLSFFP